MPLIVFSMNPSDLDKSICDQEKEIRAELFDATTRSGLAGAISSVPNPVEGTCAWLLDEPLYQKWLLDDPAGYSHALRIRGRVGTGKSVMAKYLVERLSQLRTDNGTLHSDTSLTLSYFFSAERLGPRYQIVKAFLAQLIEAQPDLVKYLNRDFYLHKDSGGLFSATNRDTLWANFETVLSNTVADVVHIIVDGLDTNDYSLIGWISEKMRRLVSRSTGPTVKLLLTSRKLETPHENILGSFSVLDLDSKTGRKAIDRDIENFLCHRLSHFNIYQRDPHTADLPKKIAQKASGVFLWASLAARELETIFEEPDVPQEALMDLDKILSHLPSSLEEAYERMLLRVERPNRERAASILAWSSYSSRPLTMSELRSVINASSSSSGVAQDTNSIVAAAGSLIHVLDDDRIYFIHPTAMEFLLKKGPERRPELAAFTMRPQAAHGMIARACYQYIGDVVPDRGINTMSNDLSTSTFVENAFLDYAVRHWVEHVLQASPDVIDIFDPGDAFCKPDSMIRLRWLKQQMPNELGNLKNPEDFDIFHFAAFFGLTLLLSKWLDLDETKAQAHPPSKSSESMMQPIHWACRNGHYDCVKLLLDHGANIQSKGRGITPIVWAVRNGHSNIVRLLIQCKAKLEIVDKGLTPLGWAAWDGRHAIVAVLLEGGARLNSNSDMWLLPYLVAPWANTPRYLRSTAMKDPELLLITECTMIEAHVVSNYWTALCPALAAYAASFCASNLAGKLYKATREPGFLSWFRDAFLRPDYSISLYSPTVSQRPTCPEVYFWICHQSFLSFSTPEMLMVLCGALYMGFVNIFCLEIYRPIYRISRALLIISSAVIGLIVTCSIPVSSSTARVLSSALNFNTVNLTAYMRGNSWQKGAIIAVLALCFAVDTVLDFGFGLFPAALALGSFLAGREGRFSADLNPLNLAASRGHASVVKLLLQHGARKSQGNEDAQTAVYLAAKYANHPTLNVLLEYYGSHVSRLDDKLTTLQLAALCSRVDILAQLIEHDGDINERSARGFCALHIAAFAGHMDMTKFLISNGAEINALSRDNVSPLFAAVCGGHQEVVRALLERGADARQATMYGITPLHIAVWLGNCQTMELLLDAKATFMCKDKQGLTPLDYAAEGIRLNTWSAATTARELQSPSDPKIMTHLFMRELAKEVQETSQDYRRFDQLGFYLLRTGGTKRAAQAYQWAKGPSQSVPWYFCQGCANSSSTNGVWVCNICYITIAQPVLCNHCYLLRTESDPKLLGCAKTHSFVYVDSFCDEDDEIIDIEEEKAAQDFWLNELLSQVFPRELTATVR